MNLHTIRDPKLGLIGYIATARDGIQSGRDVQFHTVGYYDPRTDTTSDNRMRPIGQGNLLPAMLACA